MTQNVNMRDLQECFTSKSFFQYYSAFFVNERRFLINCSPQRNVNESRNTKMGDAQVHGTPKFIRLNCTEIFQNFFLQFYHYPLKLQCQKVCSLQPRVTVKHLYLACILVWCYWRYKQKLLSYENVKYIFEFS